MMTLNKTIAFKSLSWLTILYILILPTLFWLSTKSIIPRVYVEGFSVVIAMTIVSVYSRAVTLTFLFLTYIFINRLAASHSIPIAFYDFGAVALLIYYSNFSIEKFILDKIVIFLVVLEFAFGLYCFYRGWEAEAGRIGGFFHSSMQYSFATAGLSIAAYLCFSKWKRMLLLLLLWGSVLLSGSRSAGLCLIIVTFISLADDLGTFKAVILILSASCFFMLASHYFSIRAVSYNAVSDNARMVSYYEWMNRISLNDLIYGKGRYYLGSVGRFNNGINAIITESSVLTFIEAYGLLSAFILLTAPAYKILTSIPKKESIFILIAVYFTALAAPFFETPSLLLVNVILITSSLNYHLHDKRKAKDNINGAYFVESKCQKN